MPLSGAAPGCRRAPPLRDEGDVHLPASTIQGGPTTGGPSWLASRRSGAADRAASLPAPSASDELWRYTPVDGFDPGRYHAAVPPGGPGAGEVGISALGARIADRAALVLTRDGYVAAAEVGGAAVAQGVTVGKADGELALADLPDPDSLSALHDARVPEVVVVEVPAGVVVQGPVVVVHQVTGAGVAAFPHLVVVAGPTSQVTVVEHWLSGAGEAYVSPVTEVRAGEGAHVDHVGVQELGEEAWQVGWLVARAGRDATVRAWHVALGGSYARLYLDADLADQGGTVEMAGVYFGDGQQVLDFRSLQDHRGSRSRSDFLLKGAVRDSAHGIYTGLIRVHEGAKATDSFLANRNLVLADGAHVDSVPNLEIVNENDIRSCGHAAATGPVDEDHLFYLESRGVPRPAAERLVVHGFFDEVVGSLPVASLHQPLREAVASKLDRSPADG